MTTTIANPVQNFALALADSVMAPLYAMPEIRNTPRSILQSVLQGKDTMPQQSSTPWDPVTGKAISPLITEKIYRKMYDTIAANKLLSTIMPMIEADPNSNEIVWYVVRFDPELMDETSELAMGREIGFETTAKVARLRTYKKGYSFSNDMLRRPGGQEQIVDMIVQISNIQIDTACSVALNALMEADDVYRIELAKTYQVHPRPLREVFSDEIGFFDILHHDRGVGLLRDHLTHVFSRQRGSYDYLLITEEIAQQMSGSASETEYFRAGPPAIANRNFSTPLGDSSTIPTFPAFGRVETILLKTNYTTRIVPNGGIGILQQVVQIGEFYPLRHQPSSCAEMDARSNSMKIYHGGTDDYRQIDFMAAVDNARIFNDAGNPNTVDDDLYGDGQPLIKGNIRDVIWDRNGQPRYTHGEIPSEYFPANFANELTNALVKLINSRGIIKEQYARVSKLVSAVNVRAREPYTPSADYERTGSGELFDVVRPKSDGSAPQGISFDELEPEDQRAVQELADTLANFFPRNLLIGAGAAPVWSASQTSGAALWENVLIPYYPPVLVQREGGKTGRDEALAKLGVGAFFPRLGLDLLVEAWATKLGKQKDYQAIVDEFGGSAAIGANRKAQSQLKARLEEIRSAFSQQEMSAYEKLLTLKNVLGSSSDSNFYFTTLRRTPGLRLVDPYLAGDAAMPAVPAPSPSSSVEYKDLTEGPESVVFGEDVPEGVPEGFSPDSSSSSETYARIPGLSAYHVNEALKHHIRAIRSSPTDRYTVSKPEGLIGKVYQLGVNRQKDLGALIAARPGRFSLKAAGDKLKIRGYVAVRNESGFRGLLLALFDNEVICRESWSVWASEGLPLPVAMLIARPTISVMTATLIACKGGSETGGLYYKPSAERSGSHVRGQNQVQVQCEFAGVVKRAENVHVMRNVLSLAVLRGHTTKFFDLESFRAGPTSWFNGNDASMLAFMIPLAWDDTKMISLTGSFDHRGVHNYQNMRYVQGEGSWIGSDRANALYNFKRIAEQRKRNNDPSAEATNINLLCFAGQRWNFNAVTGRFDIMSPGSGHFHNTDTYGAALVRNCKRYNYPPLPTAV